MTSSTSCQHKQKVKRPHTRAHNNLVDTAIPLLYHCAVRCTARMEERRVWKPMLPYSLATDPRRSALVRRLSTDVAVGGMRTSKASTLSVGCALLRLPRRSRIRMVVQYHLPTQLSSNAKIKSVTLVASDGDTWNPAYSVNHCATKPSRPSNAHDGGDVLLLLLLLLLLLSSHPQKTARSQQD